MSQNELPTPDPARDGADGWPERLMAALEVEGVAPDFARLARIARVAAAASGNDDDAAATAFLAGYAAGLAEGTGQAGFDRAHGASLRAIERIVGAEVAAGHGAVRGTSAETAPQWPGPEGTPAP